MAFNSGAMAGLWPMANKLAVASGAGLSVWQWLQLAGFGVLWLMPNQ